MQIGDIIYGRVNSNDGEIQYNKEYIVLDFHQGTGTDGENNIFIKIKYSEPYYGFNYFFKSEIDLRKEKIEKLKNKICLKQEILQYVLITMGVI